MVPVEQSAWERLGRLLAERRVRINARYKNRRVFAAERDVNWRTLHDVEHAKRTNFKPETLQAFETAYMLEPGSIARTLAGGDLEPVSAAPAARRPARPVPVPVPAEPGEPDDSAWKLFPDSPEKRALWRLTDGDGRLLPERIRAELVAAFNHVAQEMKEEEDDGERGHRAAG